MKFFTFDRLVLADRNGKLAKTVTFLPGVNVITSPGNSKGSFVGKSIIMRSLFHALGGDGKFDVDWDPGHSLYYVLDFSVGDDKFTMVRHGSYFRLLDAQHQTIASVVTLSELGNSLSGVLGYRLKTKNEEKNEYEDSPAPYYFLLSYLDQSMDEPGIFNQFANVSSMSNAYFSDVVYGNCGLDSQQYYEKKTQLASCQQKLFALVKQRNVVQNAINEIELAKGNEPDYSSLERLKKEVELNRKTLEKANQNLAKQKKDLLKAENEKYELDLLLDQLMSYSKKAQENSSFVLNKHRCPYCDSEISDTAHVYFEHALKPAQAQAQIDETKEKIKQISLSIANLESSYATAKEENDNLEKSLFGSTEDYKDILAKFGVDKIKNQVVNKAFSLDSQITTEKQTEGALKADLKKTDDFKKEVDKRFAQSFTDTVGRFKVPGVMITSSISADTRVFQNFGDNKGLLLELIWIRSLHHAQVTNSASNDWTILPLVLDDPVNGDLDKDTRSLILDIAFNSSFVGEQLLVSAVGLKDDSAGKFTEGSHLIELSNQPFHLLNPEDYPFAETLLSSLGC